MNKQQKNQIDNLYDFSNTVNYKAQEKEKNNKRREREKRIKNRKKEQNDDFDFDIETVIGMTNRNNQKVENEKKQKMTKKQAKVTRKKKKIKRILKFVALLLIIIGGVVFALVSPIFNISEINVINCEQVSQDTIISLSQLQKGQNIFRYNREKTESEIKTNAYIETVDIKRKFPNKVEITVQERYKNFNIPAVNGFAYINNQGYILDISEQKLDLPIIQGISTVIEQVVPGNRLNVQDLEKIEIVIQIMNICKSYELDGKISIIDITDKTNYILIMEQENKTIYLGDENNLSNKMLYVPAILQENQGKKGIIYLNGDINNNFKPRFFESVDV